MPLQLVDERGVNALAPCAVGKERDAADESVLGDATRHCARLLLGIERELVQERRRDRAFRRDGIECKRRDGQARRLRVDDSDDVVLEQRAHHDAGAVGDGALRTRRRRARRPCRRAARACACRPSLMQTSRRRSRRGSRARAAACLPDSGSSSAIDASAPIGTVSTPPPARGRNAAPGCPGCCSSQSRTRRGGLRASPRLRSPRRRAVRASRARVPTSPGRGRQQVRRGQHQLVEQSSIVRRTCGRVVEQARRAPRTCARPRGAGPTRVRRGRAPRARRPRARSSTLIGAARNSTTARRRVAAVEREAALDQREQCALLVAAHATARALSSMRSASSTSPAAAYSRAASSA